MQHRARLASPIYDPSDPATLADPFAAYARLREEDPVHWSPSLKSWVITRYKDAKAIVLAPEMSPDRLTVFYRSLPPDTQRTVSELVHYLNYWLVFRDPPDHTRLRRLMSQAVTPRAIDALRPNVEAICALLLDRLSGREEADLVRDFAAMLPAYVIMDMLGVERAMLDDVRRWSSAMRLFIGSARAEPNKYGRAREGAREMATYFRSLIAERRAAPRDDVLSALTLARDDDGMLSDDELVSTCMLFLFAGHETTTNLIGSASFALITNPEEKRRLAAEPGLAETAVEEFLRFDGPTTSVVRVVATDHEFGGRALKTGDRVFAMVHSANRDGEAFPDPDRLDLGRAPNRHLAFGQGIHFCLGAPLARLEGRIAIPALHARYPDIRLAGEPRWIDSVVMRGLEALPVRLGSRA